MGDCSRSVAARQGGIRGQFRTGLDPKNWNPDWRFSPEFSTCLIYSAGQALWTQWQTAAPRLDEHAGLESSAKNVYEEYDTLLKIVWEEIMAFYALIELEITNMDGMAPYMAAVTDTITSHGGKYLVRAGRTEIAEGEIGQYPVKVVLEFPSMEAAKQWYGSTEYQAILPHRMASAKGNFVWAEGV
jgi:uncharacterized protein (DUF1330 family)